MYSITDLYLLTLMSVIINTYNKMIDKKEINLDVRALTTFGLQLPPTYQAYPRDKMSSLCLFQAMDKIS